MLTETNNCRARSAMTLIIAAAVIGLVALSVGGMIYLNYRGASDKLSSLDQTNCSNPCIVTVTSQGFNSGELVVVSKGTSIEWYNGDSISHSLVGMGNWSFSTGMINPGKTSRSISMMADGTYDYYCQTSMFLGEIEVVG